jgi:membrane protein required for colicin V production
MPLPIFDLVVIGVVIISALLAAVRGFTREVLAVASWVVAAGAAVAFYKPLLPYVQQHITNPQIALAAAIAGIFIVTLIVVSFITVRLSDFVLDSRIGAVDRSLGFIFGAGRGVLICVIAYLFFSWLVPDKMQPDWAKTARTREPLARIGTSILAMLPDDPEGYLKQLRPPKLDGEAPQDVAPVQPGAQPVPTQRSAAPTPAAPATGNNVNPATGLPNPPSSPPTSPRQTPAPTTGQAPVRP